MTIDVKYGILKELIVPKKLGIVASIANVKINAPGQDEVDEAALILSRRSFGLGRSHLILRNQIHAVLDVETLLQVAHDATTALFGTADKDDMHRIADLLLNSVDELVMHPPEDVMIERKRQQKMIEQSGVIIKVNDETILDAR